MFLLHKNLWPDGATPLWTPPPCGGESEGRMARPRKPEAEKRDEVLGVRLTTAERAEAGQRADLYGLSAAEFMRRRTFGHRMPRQAAEQRRVALIATALLRVGVLLNQIARTMNAGQGAPPELADLIARINALLDELYDGELAGDPEG